MVWHTLKEARAQKSDLAVIWLLYTDMVSLLSGSDSLKHVTKGFSVNHSLNQQVVLGIEINGEFLLAAIFL